MTAKIKLNAASGGGSFSLQAPSSSANNRVITLPDLADGTLLTSQSSLAGGAASFRVGLSGSQSLSDATYTKVLFNTEVFDPDSVYDASNSKFIAPSSGTYFFTTSLRIDNGSANIRDSAVEFKKNGSSLAKLVDDPWEAHNRYMTVQNFSITANLAANDYIEVYGYTNNTGQTASISSANSIFGGFRLS